MGRVLLGLVAAVAINGAALAQTGGGDAKATKSALLGVTFPQPGVAVDDDPLFREALDAVARTDGKTCGKMEVFGWTYPTIEAGNALIESTMKAVTNAKYRVTPVTVKAFEGRPMHPGMAVKDKKRIALLWAPQTDAATLVLCETSVPKP